MRGGVSCLLAGLMFWITPASAKDQGQWTPPAANGKDHGKPVPSVTDFREKLKDYKYEIPGAKGKKEKFDIPETAETPDYYDGLDGGPRKFSNWWFSQNYNCQLQQVAVGWQTFFLAFEPYVTYTAAATKNPDLLSIYVPSQPHPKGIPVASVDSQAFALTPKTAKTFVPDPQTQKKMLQAMKTGKIMLVKWVDGDGTRREDRYPLTGFSEAFAELLRACP